MQELRGQVTIAGPQYINMITMYSCNLVCIAAVGHVGEMELAAASMSISMYSILGQGVILSMVGALDTQASQVRTLCYHYELGHRPSWDAVAGQFCC